MDEQEIELWRQCDVGTYVGNVTAMRSWLYYVDYDLGKPDKEEHIRKSMGQLLGIAPALKARYDQVPLDELDESFPYGIFHRVQQELLPDLVEGIGYLELLVPFGEAVITREIIEDSRGIARELAECNRELAVHPRYREYRGIIPHDFKRIHVGDLA